MSIHDDARAASEAVYDKALGEAVSRAALAEIAAATAKDMQRMAEEHAAALESELEAAENTLRLALEQFGALQIEFDAYKASHPDEKPPVDPPTTTTLMGVTVTGPVRKDYTDLHDNVAVSRVFAGNVKDWSQEPQHKAFPNSKWACSNTHSLSLPELDALLKSIPAADKAKIVAWCDTHEPEHPDKGLVASEYKARMRESAKIIRANGLKVASCVMGFSIPNDKWLQWIDPTVVDYIFFDKYNSGQKKTPPVYQSPVSMVDDMVAVSKRLGKQWGLWETGTDQFGTDADRVEWTRGLRAEIEKQGGVTAIWFDRPATSGSGWNASMQPKAVAEAWLL